MSYQRYLQNEDYQSLIADDFLYQVTDSLNEIVFEKREQHAEVCVVEYLRENYCIEDEFSMGKSIIKYNPMITYPKGVFIKYEDVMVEVIKQIRGQAIPDTNIYWEEVLEDSLTKAEKDEFISYSQLVEWDEGAKVIHQDKYYICLLENGFAFDNIHIPEEVIYWKALPTDTLTDSEESETYEYDFDKADYEVGDRVEYNENFFQCLSVNVNPETPKYKVNIKEKDPRNQSVVRCMSMISLYNMHKSISPNSIPDLRIDDFKLAMKDLDNYNKFRLTPGLKRRTGTSGNGVSSDWAFGTFGNDYANNPWYV